MSESNTPTYGHVWTDPARQLHEITASKGYSEEALNAALSLGFFSQYTCYKDPSFVEKVTDWQCRLLEKTFTRFLELFPSDFEEKVDVPAETLVSRFDRRVTPDLLRNVWYSLEIRSLFGADPSFGSGNILEIGSGSGSFSRVFKALYPKAKFWLIDLPESLRFAAIYLRKSFPDARILLVESKEQAEGDLSSYDFVLLPIQLKNALRGRAFDLALNIWSFGEMPNHFITQWFATIQSECSAERIYTMNGFLPPVTVESTDRSRQGDWVFQFDRSWEILHFEVNPQIHRNPFIKNFYTGLCIAGQRVREEAGLQRITTKAEEGLTEIFPEDWTQMVLFPKTNHSRPETEFHQLPDLKLDAAHDFCLPQLLATTEYIGHFPIASGTEGTLCRLWNHFRLTRSPLSGGLLVCFLAMISKTLLNARCTKEELQLLKRLPPSNLHREYRPFLEDIAEKDELDDIQARCDEGITSYREGRYDSAIATFAAVCGMTGTHGEAWYYLAMSHAGKSESFLAALCARMALSLSDAVHYQECFENASRLAKSEKPLLARAVSALKKLRPGTCRKLFRHRVARLLDSGKNVSCVSSGAIVTIVDDLDREIILCVAEALEAEEQHDLAKAFKKRLEGV